LNNAAKDPTFDNFFGALKTATNSGRYVVPFSHYPLVCSGAKFCLKDRAIMNKYWKAMFDSKVTLYIGAHYHTYQRIFPYLPDGSFSQQTDDFRSNQNQIISIVEAVAGNDKDIVEKL
jgi:hypothetical protein